MKSEKKNISRHAGQTSFASFLKTACLFLAVAAIVFSSLPLSRAADLSENERRELERTASALRESNKFQKAAEKYRQLIDNTPDDKRKLKADYFYQHGYCLSMQQPPDFASALKRLDKALEYDSELLKAHFEKGVIYLKMANAAGASKELADENNRKARANFMLAAEKGYKVIERVRERAKNPAEAFVERVLDNTEYVFKLLGAEQFEFNYRQVEDPFRSPLTIGIPTDGKNQAILPEAEQLRRVEEAEKLYEVLREAIRKGDEKLALKTWRELQPLVTPELFDILIYKNRMMDLQVKLDDPALRAELDRLNFKIFITDAKEIIKKMNENKFRRNFVEVNSGYAELVTLVNDVKKKEYRTPLTNQEVFVKTADELLSIGRKIKLECDAIQEFESYKLKVTGIIIKPQKSMVVVNDKILLEGEPATHAIYKLVKTQPGDYRKRRLFIKNIDRTEVFFVYQVGADIKVDVSLKFNKEY